MVGGLLILACGEVGPTVEPVVEPVEVLAPAPPPFTHDDAIASALAQAPPELPAENPSTNDAKAVETGAALYEARCAACHGILGDGDGPAAAALPQRPADFTDLSRWTATNHGQKIWLLEKGIAGTPHAPSKLSHEELTDVLAYVESTFAAG